MADARGREERALTISVVIVSTVVIPEERTQTQSTDWGSWGFSNASGMAAHMEMSTCCSETPQLLNRFEELSPAAY